MPNPFGVAQGMGGQMQGQGPYPDPQQGIAFLLSLLQPNTQQPQSGLRETGQINPMGLIQDALNIGGETAMMGNVSGKGLGGMTGKMDDLARATGGFGDNAAGSIRGNIPPQGPDPGNLGAMDNMAPPGGGAPPMDMPNQAYNDIVDPWGNPGYPEGTSMGPGEVPPWEHSASSPAGEYERWSSLDMGPDDFANHDDWMRHQDYMSQGPQPEPWKYPPDSPSGEYERWSSLDMGPDDFANHDDWMRHQDYMTQGPPGPRPDLPMDYGVPEDSGMIGQILDKAQEYMSMGATPEDAMQAAVMEFSDLAVRP